MFTSGIEPLTNNAIDAIGMAAGTAILKTTINSGVLRRKGGTAVTSFLESGCLPFGRGYITHGSIHDRREAGLMR